MLFWGFRYLSRILRLAAILRHQKTAMTERVWRQRRSIHTCQIEDVARCSCWIVKAGRSVFGRTLPFDHQPSPAFPMYGVHRGCHSSLAARCLNPRLGNWSSSDLYVASVRRNLPNQRHSRLQGTNVHRTVGIRQCRGDGGSFEFLFHIMYVLFVISDSKVQR